MLVEEAFTDKRVDNTKDGKYNYARVLCHYGALVMEFLDSWAEGDGERSFRYWKLFLPHFRNKVFITSFTITVSSQGYDIPLFLTGQSTGFQNMTEHA